MTSLQQGLNRKSVGKAFAISTIVSLAFLGLTAVAMLALLGIVLLRGWAIALVWGWFLPSIWPEAPPLPVVLACGLLILLRFARGWESKPADAPKVRWRDTAMQQVLPTFLFLGLAWILKGWL